MLEEARHSDFCFAERSSTPFRGARSTLITGKWRANACPQRLLLAFNQSMYSRFSFRGTNNITGDGAVRAIARHCPSLTSLSMVELTRTLDRSLKELGRRCPLLRVLDSSSDINVLETSHRTRVPKLGADGIREVTSLGGIYLLTYTSLASPSACG